MYFLSCNFRQLAKTQEELNQAHFKLQVEIEAKENREMQLSELEQTLSKETERCTDLKVDTRPIFF